MQIEKTAKPLEITRDKTVGSLPISDTDDIPLQLTADELEVLTFFLKNPKATTAGEVQLEINKEREERQLTKISWRKIERIISILKNKLYLSSEKPPKEEKRAKERLFLDAYFYGRWKSRRMECLTLCAKMPQTALPSEILGKAVARFYQISDRPARRALHPNDMTVELTP